MPTGTDAETDRAKAKLATVTRDQWLKAFAAELGTPAPSEREIDELLALAADAAHASERTAAPLSCWIAGRSGVPLADAVAAAKRLAERAQTTAEAEGS